MEALPQWSSRARAAVASSRFCGPPPTGEHGSCQFDDGRVVWWKGGTSCEAWGYDGPWAPAAGALLEAAGALMKEKKWERLDSLTCRELEVFLRDRNSCPAFPEGEMALSEADWDRVRARVGQWRLTGGASGTYVFPPGKRFTELPLAEKIQELKAFFQSEKLLPFLRRGGRLELVDVEGTTVYLALEAADVPTAALLDWLQMVAAETFREPALNLVPEGSPSGPL